LKGVAPPEISTGDVYRGVVPFIALQLLVVAILLLFPELLSIVSVGTQH
jgi:TRAP-type mannitol/chloroaromatic compound transport system permease large subunit